MCRLKFSGGVINIYMRVFDKNCGREGRCRLRLH